MVFRLSVPGLLLLELLLLPRDEPWLLLRPRFLLLLPLPLPDMVDLDGRLSLVCRLGEEALKM